MQFPALTAGYAAVLALIYLVLSGRVIAGRLSFNVSTGDGGNQAMTVRTRGHGNFAEYVPLILLLAALLEGGGTSRPVLHALLLPLTVARAVHPAGMARTMGTSQAYLLRGLPAAITLVVMGAAAILLLLRVL